MPRDREPENAPMIMRYSNIAIGQHAMRQRGIVAPKFCERAYITTISASRKNCVLNCALLGRETSNCPIQERQSSVNR